MFNLIIGKAGGDYVDPDAMCGKGTYWQAGAKGAKGGPNDRNDPTFRKDLGLPVSGPSQAWTDGHDATTCIGSGR